MSNEELVKLIQQGNNSSDNLGQLFLQNKGLIDKIIRKYSYVYKVDSKKSVAVIEYQDLMNEAYFGIAEAAKRYEETAGVKFMTYAGFWINQSITRFLEESRSAVRIPSHMQGKIYQYNKAINAYKTQVHKNPSDKELCRYLQCEIKALSEIRLAMHRYGQIDSLDRELADEEGMLLSDTIHNDADIENEVIENMMDKSQKTELWKIVKENTTDQENDVICCRYIKNMSLESIGKNYNLTRDKVRMIEAKGLRKLRRSKITRLLAEKFEINYVRGYRGSLSNFNYTWTSIVEDIAIRNLEAEVSAVR